MSGLLNGWRELLLTELVGPKGLLSDGDWIESKDQDPDGEIRLIQLADIGDGIFIDKSSRFVTRQTAKRLNCTFLKEGDLLIARMPDPLGRSCIFPNVSQEAITAVDVFIVRPDGTKCTARWLMNAINSPEVRYSIQDQAGGTTRQRVAGGKLKALSIPTPPLEEQRRIVAKLDRLTGRATRAREELGRIPRLIQKYREVILGAAFNGDLTREWRDTHGHSEPPTVDLGSVVSDIRYGTAKKCTATANGTAVLRIPNVSAGKIDLHDLKYTNFDSGELTKLRLQEGDVLVVRSNGSADLVGRPAQVTGAAVGMAYAGYLIRLRPNKSVIDPRFLVAMLQSPEIRRVIETGARSTSGVHNINSHELASLEIPRPGLDEQREIVRLLESAFSWLDRIATEHANASRLLPKLDQAILTKAFKGELLGDD